jgi:hypothetical protein
VEKRNQLQEKFDKDMDGMKENIDKFFDRAADESYVFSASFPQASYQVSSCPSLMRHTSASRHVDFTTRLMELIMKRGDIEAQIIRHSQIVEHAYYDANKELGEILRGKLADIEAGPVTPKATRSADLQSS